LRETDMNRLLRSGAFAGTTIAAER
jgi:hypothetical protein